MTEPIERKTIVISGPNILFKCLQLKDQGYTTVWTGNGQICMIAPEDKHPDQDNTHG